jgi:hypothetical protein
MKKPFVSDLAARRIGSHCGHILLDFVVELGHALGHAQVVVGGHGEQEQGVGQGVAVLGGGREGGG